VRYHEGGQVYNRDRSQYCELPRSADQDYCVRLLIKTSCLRSRLLCLSSSEIKDTLHVAMNWACPVSWNRHVRNQAANLGLHYLGPRYTSLEVLQMQRAFVR